MRRTIRIRQSGLVDDAWILLEPHSTTMFSWDDPYGEKLLDVCINSQPESLEKLLDAGINSQPGSLVQNISLEKIVDSMIQLRAHGMRFQVMEFGDIKIVRFTDDKEALLTNEKTEPAPTGRPSSSSLHIEAETSPGPLELIIELGIVGVSLIDHRPRELLYLYLEKVFVSYSTGYDAGTTSRHV